MLADKTIRHALFPRWVPSVCLLNTNAQPLPSPFIHCDATHSQPSRRVKTGTLLFSFLLLHSVPLLVSASSPLLFSALLVRHDVLVIRCCVELLLVVPIPMQQSRKVEGRGKSNMCRTAPRRQHVHITRSSSIMPTISAPSPSQIHHQLGPRH
uniref:Uncharacterized protein n=1 Tax=Vitrella brassicaformis TaxID=1169539 RepID=A0A7S1KFX9_9ALVE